MQKNKLVLIGTTQGGRTRQIDRLLNSLIGFDNIQLLFVDQTTDNSVSAVFDKFSQSIDYVLIKADKCSLSKARNLALLKASGDIIGFCDDDAIYDRDMLFYLSSVDVKSNSLVSFPVIDPSSNENYGDRNFPKKNIVLTYNSVLKYSLSVGTFIFCRENNNLFFSELYGAGAKFGGSEESELFFRLKSTGYKTYFNPDYKVYHDNDIMFNNNLISEKYFKYAVGYGLLIKNYMVKSRFLLLVELIRILFRSVVGVLVSRNKSLYINRIRGLIKGFFTKEELI